MDVEAMRTADEMDFDIDFHDLWEIKIPQYHKEDTPREFEV
jgi:hypothetical protein